MLVFLKSYIRRYLYSVSTYNNRKRRRERGELREQSYMCYVSLKTPMDIAFACSALLEPEQMWACLTFTLHFSSQQERQDRQIIINLRVILSWPSPSIAVNTIGFGKKQFSYSLRIPSPSFPIPQNIIINYNSRLVNSYQVICKLRRFAKLWKIINSSMYTTFCHIEVLQYFRNRE